MKKILIVILMLFLLSGCNINYDLSISKNMNFEEKIEITGNINENFGGDFSENDLKDYFNSIVSYKENYKILENEVNNKNFKVSYTSNNDKIDKFLKSESLITLYNNAKIYKKDNIYIFDMKRIEEIEEEAYTPLEFENIKVTIYSEKKIINSNADKIIFNKYIWEMKDSDIKDIYFELTDENDFIVRPIYFVITGVIIVSIPIFLLIRKSKKNNAI